MEKENLLKVLKGIKTWFQSMELDNQERRKEADIPEVKAYFDGFIHALQLGSNHIEFLEQLYSEEESK